MDLSPRTRIADRYVIERALAKGGMGAVFVARDERMDARVALKVTAAGGAAAEEVARRFAREARIGHRLGTRGRGFVRASDWGRVDAAQLYLVMDLIEGAKPLDLRSGTLEERIARWRRAAELVQIAHENGVIHRDLKPANFLQAADASIYLTDFGLAKVVGEEEQPVAEASLTMTGIGFGTPPYMPPEQLEDAKRADQRADVYALGCMLFEAATGKLPYPGPNPTAVLSAHMKVRAGMTQPPTPRTIVDSTPHALDEACRHAIELDVNQRTSSVRDLLLALSSSGRGSGVSLGSAPTSPDQSWHTAGSDPTGQLSPEASDATHPHAPPASSHRRANRRAGRSQRSPDDQEHGQAEPTARFGLVPVLIGTILTLGFYLLIAVKTVEDLGHGASRRTAQRLPGVALRLVLYCLALIATAVSAAGSVVSSQHYQASSSSVDLQRRELQQLGSRWTHYNELEVEFFSPLANMTNGQGLHRIRRSRPYPQSTEERFVSTDEVGRLLYELDSSAGTQSLIQDVVAGETRLREAMRSRDYDNRMEFRWWGALWVALALGALPLFGTLGAFREAACGSTRSDPGPQWSVRRWVDRILAGTSLLPLLGCCVVLLSEPMSWRHSDLLRNNFGVGGLGWLFALFVVPVRMFGALRRIQAER